MPRKGHKSQSGIGDLYDERKQNVNITLTPFGKNALEEKARLLGISKSELIERVARGELQIHHDPEKKLNWSLIWWILG